MRGIADYRFVRQLGEGNHGRFWLAEPPARLGLDDQYVAVKTLAHKASDDDFRRFANELQLYAAVDSEHLVRVLDAGHQGGELFYAAEYCPGGNLADPASELTEGAVVAAVADAARAAHALHEVGVAHRDIKPANVMVTDAGGKLGDLGLAQVLNPGQTITGIGPLGAIDYLAPEILRGDRAGRASDVYSLGATLHRALTGRSLFPDLPGDDLVAALRHVIERPPTVSATLRGPLSGIVERCLAADPAERYLTAAALAEALDQLDTVTTGSEAR
jgi:eukaryotic-like serine/threonine-protein kinase